MEIKKIVFSSRKRVPIQILLLVVMTIFLSGCSGNAKSKSAIVKDLQEHKAFISPTLTIDDCEIVKRQTDTGNRSDIVYVTVHGENELLDCTLSYIMKYELYNEGWQLESVSRYSEGPWEILGLKNEQITTDIMDYDYYFSDYGLEVQNIEITDEGYNSSASTWYEKWYSVNVNAEKYTGASFNYYAVYNLFYKISEGAWELQSVELQNRSYAPTISPSVNASDEVMKTLEMQLHLGDGILYDSFEYLRTEEDWENCNEIRYYVATKKWFYGTEKFLIAIPIYFYLEDGEAHWNYNLDGITHTLQNVDWNITGEWRCNNNYVVQLRIDDVVATDDPNIYKVNLYCDAYSTINRYGCYGASGELSYSNGYWELTIQEPSNLDSDIVWRGNFDFYGYEYIRYQGVCWHLMYNPYTYEIEFQRT